MNGCSIRVTTLKPKALKNEFSYKAQKKQEKVQLTSALSPSRIGSGESLRSALSSKGINGLKKEIQDSSNK